MSEWVSVKDRKPDTEVDVLVFSGRYMKVFQRWDFSGHNSPDVWYEDGMPFITIEDNHSWMPLPAPPK